MKKVCFAAALALALSASAELKIAVVNMVDLVKLHPQHETNAQLVKSTNQDYKDKLEAQQEAARAVLEEGKKAQQDLQNPLLTAKAKAAAQKRVDDVQQKLVNARQDLDAAARHYQMELQDLESRLLKIETDDIRAKLAAFAKKEGWDLILDSTTVGYAKSSLDVTDAVLETMGVDPAKRKDLARKGARTPAKTKADDKETK